MSGVGQKHRKRGQGTTEEDKINTEVLLYTYYCCGLSQNEKSKGGLDPIDGWGKEEKRKDKEYGQSRTKIISIFI